MKNLYLIPTDKPSRLHLGNSGLILCDLIFNSGTINSQNIYITNDEEIKDGEYGLSKLNEVVRFGKKFNTLLYKKIILTTDQDLIKDGVQAIDDSFLEWFVKNPSCEEVETVFACRGFNGTIPNLIPIGEYKIIIPKEEVKQIKCYCGHTDYCDCSPLEEPKQERMYSEEDLISFAHFYFKEEFNSTMQTSKSTDEILQEWFEQFKKK